MMSSCCTLRLKRRKAFSRDSPSCSRISAKQTHPQTRPEGRISYYKDLTVSQVGRVKKVAWSVEVRLRRPFSRRVGFAVEDTRHWALGSLWGVDNNRGRGLGRR